MSGGGDGGVLLASRLSVVLGVIFIAKMSGVDGQAGMGIVSGGDMAGSRIFEGWVQCAAAKDGGLEG